MRAYKGVRQLAGAQPQRGAPQQPRTRKPNARKQARLAEIEAVAVPGRTVIRADVCAWCGFRIGNRGHDNCPKDDR